MSNPISDKQLAMLRKIAAGEDPAQGVSGRSAWGGFHAIRTSLTRRGWVSHGQVTLAGQQELVRAAEKEQGP